jgi:2,4-dienoyl-CoA reductase-like NADH-dependent reductase (Old Yellow Enzyme family)
MENLKSEAGAVAPSFVRDDPYFPEEYRPITEDEIWDIIHAFGDAAQRAREADFDAVQVHGAHAFLFSQFLSPVTNHRNDQWGGGLENRLRLHCEVYREIKAKAGDDYPILIKIGVQDGFAGGLELDEGKLAARMLDQCGYDSLEISQGLRGKPYGETEFRTQINRPDQEGYFRRWCIDIKKEVGAPVMMVGGLRSPGLMEEIVQKKEADFISLCRPFIREPGIVNDWDNGSHQRAKCISCNKCLEAIRTGEALHCVQQKIEDDRQKAKY